MPALSGDCTVAAGTTTVTCSANSGSANDSAARAAASSASSAAASASTAANAASTAAASANTAANAALPKTGGEITGNLIIDNQLSSAYLSVVGTDNTQINSTGGNVYLSDGWESITLNSFVNQTYIFGVSGLNFSDGSSNSIYTNNGGAFMADSAADTLNLSSGSANLYGGGYASIADVGYGDTISVNNGTISLAPLMFSGYLFNVDGFSLTDNNCNTITDTGTAIYMSDSTSDLVQISPSGGVQISANGPSSSVSMGERLSGGTVFIDGNTSTLTLGENALVFLFGSTFKINSPNIKLDQLSGVGTAGYICADAAGNLSIALTC
jgi:hypothetical protein